MADENKDKDDMEIKYPKLWEILRKKGYVRNKSESTSKLNEQK